MQLPKGIDIILGMPWLRRYKPRIDWDRKTISYSTTLEEEGYWHPGKDSKERAPVDIDDKWTTGREGLVSRKQMQRIIRHEPGNVRIAILRPMEVTATGWKGRDMILNVKSLTKRRLEAILTPTEN